MPEGIPDEPITAEAVPEPSANADEAEVEGHFMSMGGIPTKPITITIPPPPSGGGKQKTYDFTSDSIEG